MREKQKEYRKNEGKEGIFLDEKDLQQLIKLTVNETIKEYIREQDKRNRAEESREEERVKERLRSYRGLKVATAQMRERLYSESFAKVPLQDMTEDITSPEVGEITEDRRKAREQYHALRLIESALERYKEACILPGSEEKKRRFREMWHLYISDTPYSVKEIAEAESISVKTVYKDIKILCHELSEYL